MLNKLSNLRIQDAANYLSVSTKTLRRWDKAGKLVPSITSSGGHRYYSLQQLQDFKITPAVIPVKKNYSYLYKTLGIAGLVALFVGFVFQGRILTDHKGETLKVKSAEGLTLGVSSDGTSPSISGFTFAVNVPAKFSEEVVFLKDIIAPNVVNSINGKTGDATIAFELEAGTGITVDGLKVTNSGIVSLTAGTGISVSGSTITNSGITSLTAGTGISVSGSTITNTLDLTTSGWTDSGTTLKLTTITDSVGIGIASPTSTLHVVGSTNLAGSVILGSASTDTLTFTGRIANGTSLLPNTDLGADIGSSSLRINNIWVANLNSNSSQAFSGQTTFSYAPTATTIAQASVLINPTTSVTSGQLLGLSIAGYQRALIDAEGDIILGYSDATSAPASDYPLNIYGHSGTRVSFVDTSGNGNFSGNLSLGSSNAGTLYFGGTSYYLRESSGIWYFTGIAGEELTIDLNAGSASTFSITQGDFIFDNNALDEDIYLKVNDGGVDTTALTVQGSTGNVGIGTTEPGAKLEIVNPSTNQVRLSYDIGTNYTNIYTASNGAFTVNSNVNIDSSFNRGIMVASGYGFTVNSYNTSLVNNILTLYSAGKVTGGSNGDWQFNDGSVNTVMFKAGGNVGIGTTGPSAKLHVLGTTEQQRLGYDTSNYWTNTIGSTGGLTMQGVGAGGALTLSPTAGQNVNVALSGSGNLSLAGTSGVDALRLTASGTKVLGLSYASNQATFDMISTDPTNKLLNNTFDTDLTSWSEVPSYTLNDQFTTDRAAGAVNGTSAEPTGGTRTVVDTGNKLSITSSILTFTAGSGWGNPGIYYPSTSRVAGKMITGLMGATSGQQMLGFDTDTTSTHSAHGFYQSNSGVQLNIFDNETINQSTGISVSGTQYQVSVVLRSTGAFYYIKGGTFTNWTLLWISNLNSTATLYPSVIGIDGAFTADNIKIPTATWLPTPLSYDTFTRADGAIGSSETTGPDSQTTPSLAWTGGAISTNKNVITPTLGSELVVNGGFATDTDWTKGTGWSIGSGVATHVTGASSQIEQSVLTVDQWYQAVWTITSTDGISAWARYGGARNGPYRTTTGTFTETNRAGTGTYASIYHLTGGTVSVDNVSFKPLTLSSLFSSVSTSDTDVIADTNVTWTLGTEAGLVTNLDSSSSPANFLIAYLIPAGNSETGMLINLDKNVGGTYTNLISAAATYSAGATLRVITYTSAGALKVRVYYNNTMVGSEQTVSDAGIISNNKHGLFSTYSGNSFDNFTLWPRGSGTTKFTDAPFEELTVTRDTTTKYNNSTASVKLVAGGTDANYVQSVNVGDTLTYNLIAYAYTTGAAVTSADASLYYDTAVLATTYTAMGGTGWYKLTGSLTGVASAKDYGVRVKAGKTVYVDEMHLQVGTGTTQTMYVMNSNTGVTGLNVQGLVNGTTNGIATLTKAGTVSDADFTDTAVNGLMGIDTTNHRLYFREGGTWSYIARTGGFQIPAGEVGDLQIGDNLMPYVESRMEDGALHGLYKKYDNTSLPSLSVVGDTTLGDAIITGSLLANDINSTLTLKLQSLDLAGIEFVGGKIKFTKEGLIYGNDLIRGKEMIKTGQTDVIVNKTWTEAPVSITLTPEYQTSSWVTEITNTGFKINVNSSPTATESGIYWQAIW